MIRYSIIPTKKYDNLSPRSVAPRTRQGPQDLTIVHMGGGDCRNAGSQAVCTTARGRGRIWLRPPSLASYNIASARRNSSFSLRCAG